MITLKQFLSEGVIKDDTGVIEWNWKYDLKDEEDDDYLPKGYSYRKVIELALVDVKKPGNGAGSALMKKFLEHPDVKKAELIFGDPMPGTGVNHDSKLSHSEQIARIKNFMSKFGFRSRDKHTNRMWIVLKGTIPDDKLPT